MPNQYTFDLPEPTLFLDRVANEYEGLCLAISKRLDRVVVYWLSVGNSVTIYDTGRSLLAGGR